MVTSSSLNIKSLFLFFSISVSIANKNLSSVLIASKVSGKCTFKKLSRSFKLQTGTWKVENAVSSCKNDIKINQVCGNSHHNRQGLGYTTTPKVPRHKSSKHYQIYISEYHKSIDDTYAFSKAAQLQVQGQWARWMNYVQQCFSWASLMAIPAS